MFKYIRLKKKKDAIILSSHSFQRQWDLSIKSQEDHLVI